jgi:flagellar protein FliJ
MRSRDTLIRLKRFQVDEKRRRVAQTEAMIADFERMSTDLDREIANEEAKTGISDKAHFAYPTYAKAALARRDNIRQSVENLQRQLEEARAELQDAYEELKKVEILEDRENTRDRSMKAIRDQLEMDRIGFNRPNQFGSNS